MTLQIPGTDKEKDELITTMYEALKKVFSRQIIKNGRVVQRGSPSWTEVTEIRKALAKAGGKR